MLRYDNMDKSRGFTIIELLSVIAVVTVLAGIVFLNVTKFMNKSKDAALKQDLNSLTVKGPIFFESHGNYGSFCNAEADKIINNIKIPSGMVVGCDTKENTWKACCHHEDTGWCACARLYLPVDGSKAWCIDSLGVKKEINTSKCKNGMASCP